jgi:CRISPR-associated protein Csb2
MPIIELSFPAGRFHATPWGRHVNEGTVEWPPAPWRLLRALMATWYLKARTDIDDVTVQSLVHALANVAPQFQLPAASLGHTRHYMPGKGTDKPKVFDAFIHVSGPVLAAWEIALTAEQTKALGLLCSRLSYLGRAEGLVEASLLPDDHSFNANASPLAESANVQPGKELVRLLAPQSEGEFSTWLAAQVPAETKVAKKGSKPKKPTGPKLPTSLFEALGADTGDLQAAGWTWPPGSQLVDYVRADDCFDLAPVGRKPNKSKPTVARFAVASAVLPRITKALSVAERVHQSLVKYSDQAAVFTGTNGGTPLTGHTHAHIFCEANGSRSVMNKPGPPDVITHVTVYAPMGMDEKAQEACETLTRKGVWGHGGHDLQLVLLGFGDTNTFADCALFKKSKVWQSLTPFISTRHAKTRNDHTAKLDANGLQIGSPEHDLRRLMNVEEKLHATQIEPKLETEVRKRRVHVLDYMTQRNTGGGRHGHQPPTAFKLTFSDEVKGPLAFGYGSHFGLGLFVPVDPSS